MRTHQLIYLRRRTKNAANPKTARAIVPGSGTTVRLKDSRPAKSAGRPGGLAVESPGVNPNTPDIPVSAPFVPEAASNESAPFQAFT